ncbi:MAG: M55 family metallopeptidase [Anaerolineaceae bacterium]|nr:M55 family metallopeptidase [Anaerolineaceae bacterium]
MKVFISADMEGISGIHNRTCIIQGEPDYVRGRHLMTADVNAAVEGLLAVGADEILINDSHGNMDNILIEELNPAASLISGSLKMGGMMTGLDESFAAVVLLGYHSMAGTRGLMAHTISGKHFAEIRVNGNPFGESALSAAIAGYFGVPVIAASGDDHLCAELKQMLPWVEFAQVKKGVSNRAAELLSLEKAHQAISAAVGRGLERLSQKTLFSVTAPLEIELRLMTPAMADAASYLLGVRRLDGVHVAYTAPDILSANNMIRGIVSTLSSLG